MKTIIRPEKSSWECLCIRPSFQKGDLEEKVREILNRVKSEKDKAILDYSEKFDGVRPASLKVSEEEISQSIGQIPDEIKKAIGIARKNIEKFHSAQLSSEPHI